MSLRPAAFVRVEGVLLPAHTLRSALYLGATTPGFSQRVARWGGWVASAPLAAGLAVLDRRGLRRLAAYHLRGLSRDRVDALSSEYAERFLTEETLRPSGLALLERARAEGRPLVLVSRGLRSSLVALAERLGAAALIASELEFRDDVATGRIEEPPSGWVEDVAARLELSLPGSYGYGVDLADVEVLERVGYPCALRPDLGLRRRAAREGWPVLDPQDAA